MEYTSVKLPKQLTKMFSEKEDFELYRTFSEFVTESTRLRLKEMK